MQTTKPFSNQTTSTGINWLRLIAVAFALLIGLLPSGSQLRSAGECYPVTTLQCEEVVVELPFSLNFDGTEGGLVDNNGDGTGFTMVDPPSARLAVDAPVFDTNVPGYEPSRLDLNTGTSTLTIVTSKGIQFRNNVQSSNTNSLLNALGVGVEADNQIIRLSTVINSPQSTVANSSQAGLWYGINEAEYVKLVVVAQGGSNVKVQLVSEIGDGVAIPLELNTANFTAPTSIELVLIVDRTTGAATGFYGLNGAAPTTQVTEGAFSSRAVSAALLAGVNHDANPATPNIAYAGIFATKRNTVNTTAVLYTFASFNVSDLTAPAAPTGLTADAGDTTIELNWAASPESDVAGYNVYRSLTSPVDTSGEPANGATLITTTTATDTGLTNGLTYYYAITAVDTSGNESLASAEASATPVAPSTPCYPLSNLECDDLDVSLPFSLTFGGTEGGILDTGFTMVDPPSNILADATGADPNVTGLVAANLTVSGGNLSILTHKGIAYLCPVAGPNCPATSANTNSQMNTLGVGLDTSPNSGVYNITATLPSLPTSATTAQAQQGGIWFGVDEDNFVKLVVARVAGGYNVELRREIGAASLNTTADQLLATSTGITAGDTVTLRLQIDTDANTITGFYQESGFPEQQVTASSLVLPAVYLNGLDHDSDPLTPALTFAGVFATKRNQDAGVALTYSFSEFAINQVDAVAPAAPTDLAATSGTGQVALTWSPNSEGDLAGYNLYRSTTSPVDISGAPLNGGTLLNGLGYIDTAVSNGTTYYYVLTAVDTSANESDASNEVSGTPTAAGAPCYPLSSLECDDLEVSLPFSLTFDGSEGGISSTGFTMVDPPGNLLVDATGSDPNVTGLIEGNLSVAGGNLSITATKGIAFRCPAGCPNTSVGTNSQMNAMGVLFDAENGGAAYYIETTFVVQAPAQNGTANQAGLWFGLNEANFVKLVVVSDTGTNALIEMRREVNDTSADADQIQQEGVTGLIGSTVTLRLVIDPNAGTMTPYYGVNGGALQLVVDNNATNNGLSILTLPTSYVDGFDHDSNPGTPALSAAGIFATRRNATNDTVFVVPFSHFDIVSLASDPTLVFTPATLGFSIQEGGSTDSDTVTLSTSDDANVAFTVTNVGAQPGWLSSFTLNGNTGVSGTPITVVVDADGLAPAVYTHTLEATATGYDPAELTVELTVTSASTFAVNVNFQSQWQGQTATTPPASPVQLVPPVGYLADWGEGYGLRTHVTQGSSNFTYGWVNRTNGNPISLVNLGRDRNVNADERLDTFMHMDHPTVALNRGYWEIAVPNGLYDVTVSVGDPGPQIDSVHRIVVEGVVAIAGFVPTAQNQFATATVQVVVSDGLLTIDDQPGTNGSLNTKINYVQIVSSTGGLPRPAVVTTSPNPGASGVPVGNGIATDLLYLPNGGLNNATLTNSTVYLYPTAGGDVPANHVPAQVNGTGGGDAIILQPLADLNPTTNYTFVITDGVEDVTGEAMIPFSMTFTTGPANPGGPTPVEFEKINTGVASRLYTALTMGPDGRLYAATYDPNAATNNGDSVFAWDVNVVTGALTNQQILTTSIAALKDKSIIGLAFDPISTPTNMVLWISVNEDGVSGAANFTSEIGRLISNDSGATWTYQPMIVELPRSTRDHLTNSIAFNLNNPGDRAFYFLEGSLSAMGAPDSSWGNRAETLLSAALLRVDIDLLEAHVTGTSAPLNANTGSDGYGNPTGGNYDPSAANAPLTIYASGIRNAYDLVWHTNGQLYVPTNGSAAGGNTPGTPGTLPAQCDERIDGNPYTGGAVSGISGVNQTQPDLLFRVTEGSYYGHPNPARCEWVMNGGNPTAGSDPYQVSQYPVGTNTDPSWGGVSFNFANNKSPNGVIEYRSSTFGGALQGKILVVRYSQGDDIIALEPGGVALDIISSEVGFPGTTGLADPLDLTEDTRNGFIYVAELAGQRITLLRPIVSDTTPPAAPTGLAATPAAGQVSLNWNANVEADLAGYNLFRSTNPSVALTLDNRVNNTLIVGTNYVDTNVIGGVTYYYVLAAVDNDGNQSTGSNEVSATPLTGGGSPEIRSVNPVDSATGVLRNTIVTAEVDLPNLGQGVDETTLGGNVYLMPVGGTYPADAVAGNVNTSGGGDVLVFTPTSLLDSNTAYQFVVTSGLQDTGGNPFIPFSSVFTTGTDDGNGNNLNISFERVNIDPLDPQNTGSLDTRGLGVTGVAIGPDGRLYGVTISGNIYRWDILPNGTLTNQTTITTVVDPLANDGLGSGMRNIIGLAFDPASTAGNLILWISHSPAFFVNTDDWTGVISRLSGPNLEVMQNFVVGLPKSTGDHQTNGIAFGPAGDLFILVGGNTSIGAPDSVWGNRPERLLSAALLRLHMDRLPAPGSLPIDTQTEEGGTYNPFAVNAPVTLYATGLRNMYDLVFHTNGQLYVPTNSAAAQGNTPSVNTASLPAACATSRIDLGVNGPYTGPSVTGFSGLSFAPSDWLYSVEEGRYYGHPNPTRCEWVLNGGDPLAGNEPAGWLDNLRIPQYINGTMPDRNFDLGGVVFDFGPHKSPNGVIEYRSSVFSGQLQGKLIVVRYSGGDDLVVLDPAVLDGSETAGVSYGVPGFTGFADPLDIVENTTNGFLYVAEFPQSNYSNSRIVLLRPVTTLPNMVVSPPQLVFQQVTSNPATAPQTVRIDNTGAGPLVISSLSLDGANANQFAISSAPTLPATIPAGSFININITFDATTNGPKHALLQIDSNDPDTPLATVRLDGLGVNGLGGANEPSLQWILDTLGYGTNAGLTNGINVGDDNAATNIIHSTNFGSPILGDEVLLPVFRKAGAGNVTIEVLSVYGPTSNNPTVNFGWYTEDNIASASQLFSVASANGQSLLPPIVGGGNLSFDPGATNFGIYSEWPAFANRRVYSQDVYNTWDASIQHKVRVYPLRLENGTLVPNAYVVATEEHTAGHDYQDIVVILRNVEPADQSQAQIRYENLTPLPEDDVLAFSHINGGVGGGHKFHNKNTLRLFNDGIDPLVVSNVTVAAVAGRPSDPCYFKLPVGLSLPIVVNPGNQFDLVVDFNPAGCTNNKSLRQANLLLQTNDPNNPLVTVFLTGFNMTNPEGNNEPDMQQLVNTFAWNVVITYPGQSLANPPYREAVGEEVLSYFWTRFSPNEPVTVTQIAAYHGCFNSDSFQLVYQGGGNLLNMSHGSQWCQSIMPRSNNTATNETFGSFVVGNANPAMGANFSIQAAGYNSSDINRQGIRIWPLRDRFSNLIPHTYLIIQDFVPNYGAGASGGQNYDYNDNVYVISNVRPLTPSPNDPSFPALWPSMPELILEFDQAYPGTLLDNGGATTGFTDTQRNSTPGPGDPPNPRYGDVSTPHLPPSTSYNPSLLDVDTIGSGTLTVTTTAGINTAANSLVNGLCLSFDSTNTRYSVNATILGPLPMTAASQQAGVMMGQDQQNYIKLVAQGAAGGARNLVFFREFSGTTATISTTAIPNHANIASITLHLIGNPAAGTVTAAYQATYTDSTPATGLVELTTLIMPNDMLGRFFVPSSNGCIITSHTGTTTPMDVVFDRFAIENATPDSVRVPLFRINVAGQSYVDSDNNIWQSDIGSGWYSPLAAVAENAVGSPTAPIELTDDDTLYQTYRGNVGAVTPRDVTYNLPLPAGVTLVDVRLHFHEPYWGVPGGSGSGDGGIYKRVFDVLIEGELRLNDFDPTAATGTYRRAIVVPINNIAVDDGVLTITFSAEVDYAMISAIEVLADPAGINWPPTAFAGDDVTIPLSSSYTLSGIASDVETALEDLDMSWTQTGGPAVTLTDCGLNLGNNRYECDFTAPATDTVLTFAFSVTDDGSPAQNATDSISIFVGDTPISGLSLSCPTAGFVNVQFDCEASVAAGNNVIYNWNFGDGTTVNNGGTEQSHTYNLPNVYIVTLTAVNGQGSVQTTAQILVEIPAELVYRINAGGPAFTDADGRQWTADAVLGLGGYRVSGNLAAHAVAISNTNNPGDGTGTSDAQLYQTEAWGGGSGQPQLAYAFPVSNGVYTVRLHFAETYFGAPGGGPAGNNRLFSIQLEGQTVLSSFDPKAVHGLQTAAVYTFVVPVSDGTLNILGTATVDNAAIKAIEILNLTPTFAPVDNQLNYEGQAVSLPVSATDPENGPITYGASNLPPGLSINPVSGVISGTIGAGGVAGSPYTVTVTANDGRTTGSTTFTWVVEISALSVVCSTPVSLGIPTDCTASIGGAVNPVFDWDFGDGTTIDDGGTAQSHSFTTTGNKIVSVTVTFDGGNDAATTNVLVVANFPPNADAGADQSVAVSATDVTLTGVGSDVEDDFNSVPLTMLWEQVIVGSEPVVTLDCNAAGDVCTFDAPASDSVLTFRFTVTDSNSNADNDTMHVFVGDVPATDLNLTCQTPVFVGNVTDCLVTYSAGTNLTFDWDFGDTTTIDDGAPNQSHTYNIAGVQTVTVTVSNGQGSQPVTFDVTVLPESTATLLRINAGGPAFTDSEGREWSADGATIDGGYRTAGNTGGNANVGLIITNTNNPGDGTGTSDETLYRTEAWGGSGGAPAPVLSYAIPVANGTYTVQLHFAEIYWGAAGGGSAANNRVMDVFAEGVQIIDDFDPKEEGVGYAHALAFVVTVTDGELNLNFTASTDNAQVSGIEVLNRGPSLVAPADRTDNEGTFVSFGLSASDPESDDLTYYATGLPSGITINADTGVISGTLGYDTAGVYNVNVSVSDGNGIANSGFTWTVNNVNRPPVLSAIGNQTVTEGQVLVVNISASDPDSDNLDFSATGLPSFASLVDNGNNTATLTISPAFGDAGVYLNNSVLVVDGLGGFDEETFTITVEDGNVAPVLAAIGDQSVDEGQNLTLNLSATDGNNDPLTFSTGTLPSFATFTDNGDGTATLEFDPGFDDAGLYTITVMVSDGNGGEDSETFDLTVNDVNRDPVLTAIGDQSVDEGQNLTLNLSASDPDGDDVSFSTGTLPSFATFTDNGDGTATLEFDPGFDDAGLYTITVTVSDGNGGEDSETFDLTVNDVNRDPVLSAIGNQSVDEGQNLTLNLSASDPDGDDVSFSTGTLPSFATFTDNGDGTATLEFDPGFDDAGLYTITVTVSDGNGGEDSETFDLTVNDVNRDPVLSAIGNQSVDEGQTENVNLSANDADGDTLTFSLNVGAPDFLSITSTGANTATLTIAPDFDDAGLYTVTVTVSDGNGGEDSETFDITINNVNRDPVLDPIGNQSVDEDTTEIVNLSATDPDGDDLTFSIANQPSFVTLVDNGDGTATLTISPEFGDAGNYPGIIITVSDGNGGEDSETISISVGDVNRSPELDDVADQSVDEGAVLVVNISVSDPDGDTMFLNTTNLPSFATAQLNQAGGSGTVVLTFSPGFDDAGVYEDITVTVTDGNGGFDSVTFDLTVNNVNRGPQVTNPGDQNSTVGDVISLQIAATDPDGDDLFYSATGLPTGLSIDLNTGEITGTIASGAQGIYNVTVTVTDGDAPLNASIEFDWNVAPLTGSITIAKESTEAGSFEFNGTGDFGTITVDTGESETVSNLLSGSYTITETPATDFALQSVVCIDNATSDEISFTVNLGDNSVTFTLAEGQDVTCTFTNEYIEPAIVYTVYLPTLRTPMVAPDLVVESISATTGGAVTIVIRNIGNAPVVNTFWVDLYVNPDPVPTGVNEVWNDGRSLVGATWVVNGAGLADLTPGGSLTLTLNDSFYISATSNYTAQPAGTILYVQVDSANVGNPNGAVLENHEITGGTYNNIISTTVGAAGRISGSLPAPTVTVSGGASDPAPPRP